MFNRGYRGATIGLLIFGLIFVLGAGRQSLAQTLTINGSATARVMVGEPFKIEYTFAADSVARGEAWIDVDGDSVVSPPDILMFQTVQWHNLLIDGGPGDMDTLRNGVYTEEIQEFFPLSPAVFILRVIERGGATASARLIYLPPPGLPVIRGTVVGAANTRGVVVVAYPAMDWPPGEPGAPPPGEPGTPPPGDPGAPPPPNPPLLAKGGNGADFLTSHQSPFVAQGQFFDCFQNGGPGDEPFMPPPFVAAVSDSDGHFTLHVPRIDPRWVVVVERFPDPDYFPDPAALPLPVEMLSDTVDIEIPFVAAQAAIRGVVMDHEGNPLKDALGNEIAPEVALALNEQPPILFRRAYNGEFSFGVVPGHYALGISEDLMPLYLGARPVFVDVQPGDTAVVELVAARVDTHIVGRVFIAGKNEPVPCAWIHGFSQEGHHTESHTNADGVYRLPVSTAIAEWHVALDPMSVPPGLQPADGQWQKVAAPGDEMIDFELVPVDTGGPGNPPPVSDELKILDVHDIPGDQGLQVRVVWRGLPAERGGYQLPDGSWLDRVEQYALWRRGPAVPQDSSVHPFGKASVHVAHSFDEALAEAQRLGAGSRFKIEGEPHIWDFIVSVPAAQLPVYSYVAPTLHDSTARGKALTFFRVSAHTNDGHVLFSAPDSGYSIDNLAPVLQNVQARIVDQGVALSWLTPNSPDVIGARIYRSTSPNFTVNDGNLLGVTRDNRYLDRSGNGNYYYRIVVEDDAGNITASEPIPASVTGIAERVGEGLPDTYVLEQNYPNPFNPETQIVFGIPQNSRIRLEIYDLMGRRVRTLVNAELVAGTYRVRWDGRDDTGRKAASGIYLYKLQAPHTLLQRKMILSK